VSFLRAIVRNPGLKIVGLILALLLWFHVATNKHYEIDLQYALEYINLPEALILTAAPKEGIAVRLRASGKQLLRLWWTNRVWLLDLLGVGTGEVALNLRTGDIPLYGIEDVTVLGFAESGRLNLWLDSLEMKTVPVYTNEAFIAAPEYVRIGPLVLIPDSVQLSGPRGLLAGIDALALEPIDREEWSEEINEAVAVALPPAYNVQCAPNEVRIYQAVEKVTIRVFDSLPVTIVMTDPDELCTVKPPWVSVEVRGPESQMQFLEPDSVKVVYAAARGDTSGARCALWVDVSPPFQVLKVEPDSITVHRNEDLRTDSGD
jgi:hypothetical protein